MLLAALSFGSKASAQSYKNSLGIQLDLGEGSTLVGPAFKHFFSANSAANVSLLFGGNTTMVGFDYQYHGGISGASGLRWYAGAGASIGFFSAYGFKQTDVWLRPQVGLDFKPAAAPLAFNFDWRPMVRLTHGDAGDRFTAARFGLGMRYTF